MRQIVLAAVALLGLGSAAYAGEGNGDPFPGAFAGVTSAVNPTTVAARDQDPYQYRPAGRPVSMAGLTPAVASSQDPYPFRIAGRVITMQSSNTATASVASPASVAQGVTAPSPRG